MNVSLIALVAIIAIIIVFLSVQKKPMNMQAFARSTCPKVPLAPRSVRCEKACVNNSLAVRPTRAVFDAAYDCRFSVCDDIGEM